MIQILFCAFGLHRRALEWSRMEGPYPLGWWATSADPTMPRIIDGWGPRVLTGMHCTYCHWHEAFDL